MAGRGESATNSNTPTWFKAAAYADLNNLDETEWYIQFACRRMLNELSDVEEMKSFAHMLFTQLAERPIAVVDDVALLDFPLGFLNISVYAEALWPKGGRVMGVRPTTVSELFEHEALLKPEFRARAKRYFAELDLQTLEREHTSEMLKERRMKHLLKARLGREYSELCTEDLEEVLHETLFNEPTFASQTIVPQAMIFTANPMLPDELLVTQFRSALAHAREHFAGTGYTFQDRDELFETQRAKWVKYLVLQFLDLKKGFEITGQKITMRRSGGYSPGPTKMSRLMSI